MGRISEGKDKDKDFYTPTKNLILGRGQPGVFIKTKIFVYSRQQKCPDVFNVLINVLK